MPLEAAAMHLYDLSGASERQFFFFLVRSGKKKGVNILDFHVFIANHLKKNKTDLGTTNLLESGVLAYLDYCFFLILQERLNHLERTNSRTFSVRRKLHIVPIINTNLLGCVRATSDTSASSQDSFSSVVTELNTPRN